MFSGRKRKVNSWQKYLPSIDKLSLNHYLILAIASITIIGLSVFIGQQFFKQTPKRLASSDDNYSLDFAYRFGGENNAVVTDLDISNDYIYQIGQFENQIQLGFGYDTETLTATDQKDGFIAKYDINGQLQFANQISSLKDVELTKVIASNNGFAVVGNFNKTADFNFGKEDQFSLISKGNQDAFLIFYDINGNKIFNKQFGSLGFDQATSLTQDSNFFYLSGKISQNAKFDETILDAGSFLAKINKSDGEIVWIKNTSVENNAMEFDGENSHVEVGNHESLLMNSNFSASVWVKTNVSSEHNKYILSRHQSLDNKRVWGLLVRANTNNAGIIYSQSGSDVNYLIGNQIINDNKWHFLTLTHDGSNLNLYQNGVLMNAVPIDDLNSSDTKLVIGKSTDEGGGSDNFFNGSLDDIRIYDKALSQEEIISIYNGELISDENLKLHYDFDDQNPNQVTDLSANQKNGMIHGASYVDRNESSMSFDGVDDYVEINKTFNNTTAFTIGGWFKDVNRTRFFNSDEYGSAWQFLYGHIGMKVNGDANWTYSEAPIIDYSYYRNVVLKWDGNKLERYVDGIKDAEMLISGTWNMNLSYIGCRSDVSTECYSGKANDIQIYNRALTDEEIQKLYNDEPVDDTGLLLHYDFNDRNSTQVTDLSGNDNHGTINGSLYSDNKDTAMDFSNTEAGVTMPTTNANKDNGTISFWAKVLKTTGTNYLINTTGTSERIYFVSNSGNNFFLRLGSDLDRIYANTKPNQWYFITGSWNNGTMNFYIDGKLIDSKTYTPLASVKSVMNLGYFSPGDGDDLDGYLDDVRFYNRTLSNAEVQALYENQPIDNTGLIVHYDFDDKNPTQVTDLSGNGNHGTITGATYYTLPNQVQPTNLIYSNNKLYQTGFFSQSPLFNNQLKNALISRGENDIFLTQFDLDGNLIWNQQAGGVGDDKAWGLEVNDDHKILVGGEFGQEAYFGLEENQETLTSLGGSDAFLASYDQNQSLSWVKQIGGDNTEFGKEKITDITSDYLNNIIVAGQYNSDQLNFFDQKNETTLPLTGGTDIFLSSYNNDSQLTWAKNLVGSGDNYLNSGLSLDSKDNLYLTGNFSDTLQLGENQQQLSLTSAGNNDIFLAKYLKNVETFFNISGYYNGPILNLGKNFTLLEEVSLKTSGASVKENQLFSNQDLVTFYNFEETSGTTLTNTHTTGSCGINCNASLVNFADLSARDQVMWSGWTSQNVLLNNASLMFSDDPQADIAVIADPVGNNMDINGDFSLQLTLRTTDSDLTIIENNSGDRDNCTKSGYYLGVDEFGNLKATLHDGVSCLVNHTIQSSKESILINNDKANHVVWQLDSNNQTSNFYLNGVLIDSKDLTDEFSTIPVTGDIYLGGSNNTGDATMIIDNFAIYDRLLDDAEILSNSHKADLSFQIRFSDNGKDWTSWQTKEEMLIDSCDQNNFTSNNLTIENNSEIKIEGESSLLINPPDETATGQLEINQDLSLINLDEFDFLTFKTLSLSSENEIITNLKNTNNNYSDFRQQFEITNPLSLSDVNLITDQSDKEFVVDANNNLERIQKHFNLFEPITIYENREDQLYYLTANLINLNLGGDDQNHLYLTIDEPIASNFPPSGFTNQAKVAPWQTHYLDLNAHSNFYKKDLNNLQIVFAKRFNNPIIIDEIKAVKNYSSRLDDISCSYSVGLNQLRQSQATCQMELPFFYKNYIQYRLLVSTHNNNTTPSLKAISFFYQEDPSQHYYSEYPTTIEYNPLISGQVGTRFSVGNYLSDIKNIEGVPEKLHKLKYQASGARTGDGELLASEDNLIALYGFNEKQGSSVHTKSGACSNCTISLENFDNLSFADAKPLSGWTSQYALYGDSSLMLSSNGALNYGVVANPINNYLDITGDFTISSFIKTSANNLSIIENNNENGNSCSSKGYYLGLVNGKINFTLNDGVGCLLNILSNQTINDGKWHHLALTIIDGEKVEIYIDGSLDGLATFDTPLNLSLDSPVYLGGKNGGSDSNFFIDALAIFNRRLTPDEILTNSQQTDLYFQTRTSKDNENWQAFLGQRPEIKLDGFNESVANPWLKEPLVAYYKLNNNALDSSYYLNDAELKNTTAVTDRFDKDNQAVKFAGVDSYLIAEHQNQLNLQDDFSLNLWVKNNNQEFASNMKPLLSKWQSENDFKDVHNYQAFDASNIDGLETKGYAGGVFDGQYIYFVPYNNDSGSNGSIVRFDTTKDFKDASSYQAFDASNTDGLETKGYHGGVFDGQYIYFVPYNNDSGSNGNFLSFDTTKDFKDSSSYQAFDASNIDGLETKGYHGGVFDGQYIYFIPYSNNTTAHGNVLRLDTTKDFKDSSSYQAFDASNVDGLETKGYIGGVFDGQYIYFIPFQNSVGPHGVMLRYDTTKDFKDASSYQAFDASNINGLETKGYLGGVFDGKHIYLTPQNSDVFHNNILSFDTTKDFKDVSSYQAFDASNIDGLNTTSYAGSVFDGKNIYFIPNINTNGEHGIIFKYDTTKDFKDSNSYQAFDAGNVDNLNTKGYIGGVFDGKNIYFIPYASTNTGFLKFNTTNQSSFKLLASDQNQSGGFSGSPFGVNFYLNTTNSVYNLAANQTLNDSWNMITIIKENQNLKMLVNKKQVDSKQIAGSIIKNNFDLTLGKFQGNYGFDGSADEVRIYQKALSEDEVNKLYDIASDD